MISSVFSFLFYIYLLTKHSWWAVCNTRSIAKFELNRFELKVFFLPDWLPYQVWRVHSVLLFTYSWKENSWMHPFPKDISTIWKCKKHCPGFKLSSSCVFHTMITITLAMFIYKYLKLILDKSSLIYWVITVIKTKSI